MPRFLDNRARPPRLSEFNRRPRLPCKRSHLPPEQPEGGRVTEPEAVLPL